ncbi:hypothetical protein DNTS_000531 [Danionella cerebrum]|uniref:CASAMP N-terminal domain-containing protein n=1 Tax=Danionella cerebrum TaxID=2873325 RepID=A0A553PVW1_9TELE|nr:hypothetical protein DNTS_000531 [Danionella translucida]
MGEAASAESKESRRTFIVPSIKSMDHYDFNRAKISSSLTWLIAKAFGSGFSLYDPSLPVSVCRALESRFLPLVPVELADPLYQDQYDQQHVKPPVVSLLLSAELYCRAGSLILRSDAVKPLLGHNAVIQALAQKGLYVTDQERLSFHLAMIDTLMMAYTVEMVSVERVLACIQKMTPFIPEEDFPYDAEDAIITWMNKVRISRQ